MVSVILTPVVLEAVLAKYLLRESTSNLRGCGPGCTTRHMICRIFLGVNDNSALFMNDCFASLVSFFFPASYVGHEMSARCS